MGTALTLSLLEAGEKVRTLSHNEHNIEKLQARVPKEKLVNLSCHKGFVEDLKRVKRSMRGCDFAIHAAATKVISVCEHNPVEAINTNILGSANVIDAAIDCHVKRVTLISSDKAVNPSNIYGATKLCAERLFIHANSYSAGHPPEFLVARYGNVWKSNGSVIHAFMKQAQDGVLRVTNKECTRFHWTIDEAVNFVLDVLQHADAGTISVPRLPSYKLEDLANAFMNVYRLEQEPIITGTVQGEKLHESMISEHESHYAKEKEDRFIITPGKSCNSGGWSFSSGSNKWRLGRMALEDLIRKSIGLEFQDKGPQLYV